ncbi:phosphatases II [Paxillus ammoniavirescens]|nr:phosphatases II [Paxillus ammoniavirescens]
MTWSDAPISVDAIIDDNVYIGNLSAALSQDVRKKLGITHLLSVCTEHTFESRPNAMAITVQDSEYEDLLIHLPDACNFIQTALDQGGKVLVHCVMGISRSTTVVCAYLMMSQRLSASAAIKYVRKRRPQVHPNYGFMKQLHAFADCRYKPSCTNSEYIAWKRRQKRDVTKYLNWIADSIPVVPDQIYLTSEFPGDPDAAESLLLDMSVTHLLSISSAQLPKPNLPPIFQHCFIDIPNNAREALLLELPNACSFISDAISNGGRVLVQCRVELRACIIVCAHLMASRHISPRQAYRILEAALPLYNPTTIFYRHLELFAACAYSPTINHPVVQAWLAEKSGGPSVKVSKKPQSIVKTSTATTNSPSLTINAPASLSNCATSNSANTSFDLTAISEALARYQPANGAGSFHRQ